MDDLDRAKIAEMEHRERSLQNQRERARETEVPVESDDGVRYCLDCGGEIPKERLAARPESVRCFDCKTIKEHQDKGYR